MMSREERFLTIFERTQIFSYYKKLIAPKNVRKYGEVNGEGKLLLLMEKAILEGWLY